MIALTFDDGPSKYTVPIAELAEQYDGRVTFCVVGNRIDQFSDSLIRVSEAGHEIANHTWEHKKLSAISYEEAKNQIQKTNDKVRELTGKPTKFIRPTYGSVNDTLRQLSKDLQMPLANWQVDTEDWKSRNADSVYQTCITQVNDLSLIHISAPSKMICPAVGCSKRFRHRINVDLPLPEGPIIATTSPL